MAKRITEAEFWSRKTVAENGCWEWTGLRHKDGYGEQGHQGKLWLAHRLAWRFINGPIPCGQLICHRCDNPPCINPDHLFIGTQVDNMQDMRVKGRRRGIGMGEDNGRAILTWKQVLEIRALYKRREQYGILQPELARMYRVSQGTISGILLGQTWKDETSAR